MMGAFEMSKTIHNKSIVNLEGNINSSSEKSWHGGSYRFKFIKCVYIAFKAFHLSREFTFIAFEQLNQKIQLFCVKNWLFLTCRFSTIDCKIAPTSVCAQNAI